MSEKRDKAVELHSRGCNCAQAVLGVFCEKYGMDFETALRVAGGMGGGFRSGEICGAASGAALAIGLKHGASAPEDQEQKKICGGKTAEFVKEFRERHGAVQCRELLKAAGNKICNTLIGDAVDMLEEKGY